MAKGIKGFQPGNKLGRNSWFSSIRQPHKRGRKPSLYKKIKAFTDMEPEFELSKEDFYKILRWVMEQSENTLTPLIIDENKKPNKEIPLWLINIVLAIRNDIRCGKTTTIEMIFDRVFGKSTQPIECEAEITMEVERDFSKLSNEELMQLHNLLEKASPNNRGLSNPESVKQKIKDYSPGK